MAYEVPAFRSQLQLVAEYNPPAPQETAAAEMAAPAARCSLIMGSSSDAMFSLLLGSVTTYDQIISTSWKLFYNPYTSGK